MQSLTFVYPIIHNGQICFKIIKVKFDVIDDVINLECLSINFTVYVVNVVVVLCTLNSFMRFTNFSFSLNFQENFPLLICYRSDVFIFFLVISLYSFMMITASAYFSTLLTCLFKCSVSTFSLLMSELINCFLIHSLLSLLVLRVLPEPFFNYEEKRAIKL